MSNTKPSAAIAAAINSKSKPIEYSELMDHVMMNNPHMTRTNVQLALSTGLSKNYFKLHRLGIEKYYTMGKVPMPSTRSATIDAFGNAVRDYEHGRKTPISGIDGAILAMFDGLKHPVTSKQAFDIFVAMQPKMSGHKYAFDNALTRLSTTQQIGKTKDSMSDLNTNARAMFHFGSVELINQLKAKFAKAV